MAASAEPIDVVSFDVSRRQRAGPRLEVPDLHAALRIFTQIPLFDTWLAWLDADHRRRVSRSALVSVDDRRGGTVYGELRSNREFNRLWRLVEADDFRSVQVTAVSGRGAVLYSLGLFFLADEDTGLYMDSWAGLELTMRAAALAGGVPATVTSTIADVMVDMAVAIDGKLGAAHWSTRGGRARERPT